MSRPADLDGDHLIDYVYAGDLLGNVWRFDLTSQDPSKWAVTKVGGTPTPIYTTPGGKLQPITTKLVVASVASTSTNPRVMVEFGTGQQTAFTNNAPATYSTSQQYLIGVWDWNLSAWNSDDIAREIRRLVLELDAGGAGFGPVRSRASCSSRPSPAPTIPTRRPAAPRARRPTTPTTGPYRTAAICWADQSGCSGARDNTAGIWRSAPDYANQYDPNYPTGSITTSSQQVYEQVIFSPTLADGAFLVNTTIPPTTVAGRMLGDLGGRLDHGDQSGHRGCVHQFVLRRCEPQFSQHQQSNP